MGITVRVRITGAREMLRAFKALPKDATKELRDANTEISKELAVKIKAAANASPRQGPAVAPSVRAGRDRIPNVQAGGGRRAGRQTRRSKGQRATTAGDLVFGANFGATYLDQFPAHNGGAGQDDYFFFKTVEDNMPAIADEWTAAAERVLKKWGTD
jgi:hypothetical protein